MDLENHLHLEELKKLVNPESIIPTSIVTQDGLNDLEAENCRLVLLW